MDIRADSRSERAPLTFHYEFSVRNVSHGERMRVWIPLAHSDAFQEVKVTSKGGDLPLKQEAWQRLEKPFLAPTT